MDCEKCGITVSYVVHESALARAERTIKRLWIMCLVLIALFVITNVMWIWYNNQFEIVTTETYKEAYADNNGNAIVNGEGEVNLYGELRESDNQNDLP